MEYALTADHHRVHAFDAEKGQEYYCPVCGNQVIPRQGEVNSWHFAHVTSCMDDWKYDMSEWHRGWQSRFPENVREIVVEHRGECHRADILMGGYVIEFQHSPISAGEFELRNKFYTRAGYKVIWVFDETYLISNFAANAGKKAGEFYTPHEVSLLMSEIVASHLKGKSEIKIYDPTSGSGSLLINIGQSVAKYMSDDNNIQYYAQELKENYFLKYLTNLFMAF